MDGHSLEHARVASARRDIKYIKDMIAQQLPAFDYPDETQPFNLPHAAKCFVVQLGEERKNKATPPSSATRQTEAVVAAGMTGAETSASLQVVSQPPP